VAADLTPYVPSLVIDWSRLEPSPTWRTLEGTMVSADISGFTKLSEKLSGLGKRGAEELTLLINQCFDGMIDAAASYGGDVLKFGGDALLIFFQGPGHTERACRATIEMRATIDRPFMSPVAGRVVLRMSQGIHSGTFTFFLVEGAHRELIVTGPPVSVTVDCEAEASAGQVMLSAAAAALVPPSWLGEPLGEGRLLKRRLPAGPQHAEPPPPQATAELDCFIPAAQRALIATQAEGEHRQVTIGFIHFSGTDASLEEGEAEGVARSLQSLATIVRDATSTFGTHWLSSDVYHDGGKVILTAGAPDSSGDDEERMLRTVRAILDAAPPDIRLRAGVNRGHVFAGYLGAQRRRTYTVMGDAVNLAARLMQKSSTGELVASRQTLDWCRTRCTGVPLEPFLVKGKSRPIMASVVESIADDRAQTAERNPPFVAREAELELLEHSLTETLAGNSRPVEVTGGPGMGKSRLVAEFLKCHPDVPVLVIDCGQYARQTPYFAVRSIFRRMAGIEMSTPADAAGLHLKEWLHEVAPDLVPLLPLIAVPFAADVDSTPEADQVAPAFRQAQIHRISSALLRRVLPERAIVHIEDAHWLDEASKGLIIELGRGAKGWLMLATRAEEPPAFPADFDARTMALQPLEGAGTAALVTALARDHPHLSDRDLDVLVERSGGNPLFAIELVDSAATQTGVDTLPDSIESLFTTRIDTLAPGERQMLRQAAAIGRRVDLNLLALAAGDPSVAEERTWRPLQEFIDFAPGTVTFRHALLREVAYEGLSYKRRRTVHAAIGRVLEERFGDDSEGIELLSIHFHLAEDRPRSWRYSIRAGEAARDKWANVEATQFYERALADASHVPGLSEDDVRRAWEQLGDVAELAGRFETAATAYARARRQARAPLDEIRLLRKEGLINERRGVYRGALSWYSRALRELQHIDRGGDEAARLATMLRVDYAGVRFRQGRFKECLRWAQRAAAHAEREGDERGLAHAFYLIDLAKTYTGRDEPMYRSERALGVFEKLGEPILQANVLNNLGVAAYFEGRWGEAADFHRRARVVRERAGHAVGAAASMLNLAELLTNQGHLLEAEELLRRAVRIFEAAPYPVGAALATRILGQVAQRAGRLDEARLLLDEALTRFERLKAESFVVETLVARAEWMYAAGRPDDAASHASAALAKLGSGDSTPALVASAHRLLALVQCNFGNLDSASDEIEKSLAAAVEGKSLFEQAASLAARAIIRRTAGHPDAVVDERAAEGLCHRLGVVTVPDSAG
jgi:class 3 adenylate cyclase/tetratricopeptide (TPR) repeat protein